MTMPEAYGGADADKLYSVVQFEELSRAGSPASATACTARSSRPTSCTTARGAEAEVPAQAGHRRDDRRHRHERAGRGLRPARHQVHGLQQADGSYLLNGSKTFITNGWHADLVIVVAKTNPAAGGKGTSLLLVERGMPGFRSASA
jgi:alkylation response protein AidB-like acyl-CoA dehydrogenase